MYIYILYNTYILLYIVLCIVYNIIYVIYIYVWGSLVSQLYYISYYIRLGLPGGKMVKASAYNAGDPGSIPGLGRSPGEGNGNPLQYSCLENPMDGGA